MIARFINRVRNFLARRVAPPKENSKQQGSLLSGDIVLHDEFLSDEQFIALQHWAFDVATPLTREQRSWKELIKRDFGKNRSSRQWASNHDDMPAEPAAFVQALIDAGIVKETDIIHLAVYRWNQLSGMGLHTDGFTDTAITFYMNDTWSKDWGGDFIYYESAEHVEKGMGNAIMPARNRLIVNRSTVHHKVNYCSNTAQDRVSLQAFVFDGDAT
jgi:hypothetical protein